MYLCVLVGESSNQPILYSLSHPWVRLSWVCLYLSFQWLCYPAVLLLNFHIFPTQQSSGHSHKCGQMLPALPVSNLCLVVRDIEAQTAGNLRNIQLTIGIWVILYLGSSGNSSIDARKQQQYPVRAGSCQSRLHSSSHYHGGSVFTSLGPADQKMHL